MTPKLYSSSVFQLFSKISHTTQNLRISILNKIIRDARYCLYTTGYLPIGYVIWSEEKTLVVSAGMDDTGDILADSMDCAITPMAFGAG